MTNDWNKRRKSSLAPNYELRKNSKNDFCINTLILWSHLKYFNSSYNVIYSETCNFSTDRKINHFYSSFWQYAELRRRYSLIGKFRKKTRGKTVRKIADESSEFVCTTRPISIGENYAKLRSDAFRFVLARSVGHFFDFLSEQFFGRKSYAASVRTAWNLHESERNQGRKVMQILFIRKYVLSHWRCDDVRNSVLMRLELA